MTESIKTKRPAKPARRISRPPRDSRADSAPPVQEETFVRRASADIIPTRIAALQAEVTRLTSERAAEADDLAAMLVRVAETERAKVAAMTRAGEVEARAAALQTRAEGLEAELAAVRVDALELQRRHDEQRRSLEAAEQELRVVKDAAATAVERATMADESEAEAAQALAHARDQLEADRARVGELESRLAYAATAQSDAMLVKQREHAAAIDALAREHAVHMDALRQEHQAEIAAARASGVEALRAEHAGESMAMRVDHAAALEAAHVEHAEALDRLTAAQADAARAAEATEQRLVADARATQERLSTELTSLQEAHATAVQALKASHAEALKATENQHASAVAALRDEYATARRTASCAIEEERSTSARLKQQLTAAEARLVALRAGATRATRVLAELQHREMEATLARARSLTEALGSLEEEEVPTTPGTPAASTREAPRAVPRPSPPSAESLAVSASLDEIEIDLTE